jgi:hypothetical protein
VKRVSTRPCAFSTVFSAVLRSGGGAASPQWGKIAETFGDGVVQLGLVLLHREQVVPSAVPEPRYRLVPLPICRNGRILPPESSLATLMFFMCEWTHCSAFGIARRQALDYGAFASAGSVLQAMGRSQVVRQWILIPPCGGSNPPAPASNSVDFRESAACAVTHQKRRYFRGL